MKMATGFILIYVLFACIGPRAWAASDSVNNKSKHKVAVPISKTADNALDLRKIRRVGVGGTVAGAFGGAGMLLIFGGCVSLAYLFIRRYLEHVPVLGSPIFQLAIMVTILGFQSILMGLVAELLARTYHESQKKLTYTVRETLPREQPDD